MILPHYSHSGILLIAVQICTAGPYARANAVRAPPSQISIASFHPFEFFPPPLLLKHNASH